MGLFLYANCIRFLQIIGNVITFDYGKGVAHIGIYIGDGKMIHTSGKGSGTVGQYLNQCVKIFSVKQGNYFIETSITVEDYMNKELIYY